MVIGNPPYVRAELLSEIRPYLESTFNVFQPASDLFAYFYEKAFLILKPHGLLGFISNTFEKTTSGRKLRQFLKEKTQFVQYIDFSEVVVFEGATTYPVIIVAQNEPPQYPTFQFTKIPKSSQAAVIDIAQHTSTTVEQNTLDDANWSFKANNAQNVIAKITQHPSVLEQFGKTYRGLLTGFNEAFIISSKEKNLLEKEDKNSSKLIKPLYEGKDILKWTSPNIDKYIIFTRRGTDIDAYPAIKKWLSKYRKQLEPRNDDTMTEGRKAGSYKWFEIQDNVAYYKLFESPKIVWANLQNASKISYDDKGYYINAPSVIFSCLDKALLAVFNSKLIWYFLNSICAVRNGGYIEVKPQYFEQIPIVKYNTRQQTALSELAEKMIDATAKLQFTVSDFLTLAYTRFPNLDAKRNLETWYEGDWKTFDGELRKQKCVLLPKEQTEWSHYFEQERQKVQTIIKKIGDTDKEIDKLVYQLYGLTKEEIRIVEGDFTE